MGKGSVIRATSVFLLILTIVKAQGQLLPAGVWLPDVPLAVNEYGSNDGPVPAAARDQFCIVVDTKLQPRNFISFYEHYQRMQAIKIDTSVFSLIKKNWKTMSAVQKQEVMHKEAVHSAQLADSVHRANNATAGKQLVYFINNTSNSIYLQTQDWQFIGIVEALDKEKQWRPIQYWQYSKCGDSYLTRPVNAHSTTVFIAPAPNKGNYKTRLRYRVFGADSILYSNEFEAAINYADFERVATAKVNPMVFKKSTDKVNLPLAL